MKILFLHGPREAIEKGTQLHSLLLSGLATVSYLEESVDAFVTFDRQKDVW